MQQLTIACFSQQVMIAEASNIGSGTTSPNAFAAQFPFCSLETPPREFKSFSDQKFFFFWEVLFLFSSALLCVATVSVRGKQSISFLPRKQNKVSERERKKDIIFRLGHFSEQLILLTLKFHFWKICWLVAINFSL